MMTGMCRVYSPAASTAYLQAAAARHAHVQDHELRLRAIESGKRRSAVVGRFDLQA